MEKTKTTQELSKMRHELKQFIHNCNNRTTRKFGFIPNLNISVHMNARRALGQMHPHDYFSPITKLAFHDLTENNELPPETNLLLGLGLKFIPTPPINITQNELDHTFSRFERDIGLRVYFSGDDSEDDYNSSELRNKSSWRAPLPPSEIDTRINTFQRELEKIFVRRRTIPNLSIAQQRILKDLRKNKNIVILSADKGLGPVGITRDKYIEWGMKHLNDISTYSLITDNQAAEAANDLYQKIFQWTRKYRLDIGDATTKYIQYEIKHAMNDPFGYFYLLAKLHKSPISSRPVCSDCASLPHSVGKWVDRQLQPIVKTQNTYFKNSFELKQLFDTMETLPTNASLFTYDAVSMYTNIDTQQCIERLTSFLSDPTTLEKFPHLKPKALIEAIDIVMNNNRMRFNNLYVHQHKGIAMGMAPAPSIANLFVAIYENSNIITFPTTHLMFLRRFIDDGFGIWLRDTDNTKDTQQWELFQTIVNEMGLSWEFSHRSQTVTFMDLNITITDGKLSTSLYAKPMALHLYIPPSSCHTPGLTIGLIHGHFYRLFMLCSQEKDIELEIYEFFNRLLDRGYSLPTLIPIFLNAEQKARKRRAQQLLLQNNLLTHPHDTRDTATTVRSTTRQNNESVFLHLRYHPSNPKSHMIQDLWRRYVLTPPGETPLFQLKNRAGYPINIHRLIVAYSRAPNLGNLLSCRKIRTSQDDSIQADHG